jgi:hypothetical protein
MTKRLSGSYETNIALMIVVRVDATGSLYKKHLIMEGLMKDISRELERLRRYKNKGKRQEYETLYHELAKSEGYEELNKLIYKYEEQFPPMGDPQNGPKSLGNALFPHKPPKNRKRKR